MPAASTPVLTTKVENGSPYQLDSAQTLKASKALLAHIKTSEKSNTTTSGKQSLLQDISEDADETDESTPIWLSLTTKTHIVKDKKFKPLRLKVPHALNTSQTTTICLITADPQRTYKDLLQDPTFPPALAKRITKVVGVSKLKKKHNQYEAQRKLYAEHDIFLADDRIITQLTKLLGKTFYKTTAKRPIPVDIAEPAPKVDGKRVGKAKPVGEGRGEGAAGGRGAGTAKHVAAEIERAIASVVVSLTPSTQTAVRVGYASWDAEKLAANIESVSLGLIENHVPKKWRGVRSLHVKGPETAALPIWLADELWVDSDKILGVEEAQTKTQAANVGKKRKSSVLDGVDAVAIAGADVETDIKKKGEKKNPNKKQKVLKESNDDTLDKEIKARKEKLKKQKAEAEVDAGAEDMPKPSKRAKKTSA